MKYCANCNKEYPQEASKCSICSLPLLELSSSARRIIDQDVQSVVPPAPQTHEEVAPPRQRQADTNTQNRAQKTSSAAKFASKLFSVSGAAFGAALLVLVAIVLIFSVFSENLFGSTKNEIKDDTNSPQDSMSTPAPPSSEPTPEASGDNSTLTLEDLEISDKDQSRYLTLCQDEAWVSEENDSALSFYEDNSYLRSTLGAQEIMQGVSAVSGNVLYMSNRYGELIAYEFHIDDGFLYIVDLEANTTVYESSKTYSPEDEVINDLFDYPVTEADATSYEELVALGPWTDAETGYVLIFDSNNSYLTEFGSDSRGGYGSALVSEGYLCMVKGSMTSQVHKCSYTLSSGILTISIGTDTYTLHSKSAYEALLLKKQLDDELYAKLVEGSFWASRDDMGSYHLYFHADHTFELCRMDFTQGKEEFIRKGTAVISADKLTFTFDSTVAEYTLSLQENLLYLTNLSAGDTTTYESFRTFHY